MKNYKVNFPKNRIIPFSNLSFSSAFKDTFSELKRPWKIITFLIGLGLLTYGSLVLNCIDWDIGLSIWMAGLTYLTAAKTVEIFLYCIFFKPSKKYLWLIGCIVMDVLVADTSYIVYNKLMKIDVSDFRLENFIASSFLYIICGFIWLYKGSLKELVNDLGNFKLIKYNS